MPSAPGKTASTLGIAAFVLAQLCLLFDGMAVHHLGKTVGVDQLLLLRVLGMGTLIACLVARSGRKVAHSEQPRLQIFRAVLSVTSLWLIYYSYSHLPIAEASSINYTRPIFVALYGIVLLGERMSPSRSIATLICLFGALLAASPAFGTWNPIYLVALAGAAISGVATAALRQVGRRDDPATTLVYITGVTLIASATAIGRPLPWESWPFMLAVVACGALAVWFSLLAFQHADASLLAPYEYARLPLMVALGPLFFSEALGTSTVIGAFLIFSSGFLLLIVERWSRVQKLPVRQAG